jgi:hypothetical protein
LRVSPGSVFLLGRVFLSGACKFQRSDQVRVEILRNGSDLARERHGDRRDTVVGETFKNENYRSREGINCVQQHIESIASDNSQE